MSLHVLAASVFRELFSSADIFVVVLLASLAEEFVVTVAPNLNRSPQSLAPNSNLSPVAPDMVLNLSVLP